MLILSIMLCGFASGNALEAKSPSLTQSEIADKIAELNDKLAYDEVSYFKIDDINYTVIGVPLDTPQEMESYYPEVKIDSLIKGYNFVNFTADSDLGNYTGSTPSTQKRSINIQNADRLIINYTNDTTDLNLIVYKLNKSYNPITSFTVTEYTPESKPFLYYKKTGSTDERCIKGALLKVEGSGYGLNISFTNKKNPSAYFTTEEISALLKEVDIQNHAQDILKALRL